jgi:hypothetical protein
MAFLYSIRLSIMGFTQFEAYIRVHLGESLLILIKPTAASGGLYNTQKALGDSRLPRTTKHYHFDKFQLNGNHLFNRF